MTTQECGPAFAKKAYWDGVEQARRTAKDNNEGAAE